jgi:hypothetical protein
MVLYQTRIVEVLLQWMGSIPLRAECTYVSWPLSYTTYEIVCMSLMFWSLDTSCHLLATCTYLWTSPDVFCIKFSSNVCNNVSRHGDLVSEFGCTLYNFNSPWMYTVDYEVINWEALNYGHLKSVATDFYYNATHFLHNHAKYEFPLCNLCPASGNHQCETNVSAEGTSNVHPVLPWAM